MEHEFSDKDILGEVLRETNFDGTLEKMELDLSKGTESILLNRADIIALAKEFDIIRLI